MSLHLAEICHLLSFAFLWCWNPQYQYTSLAKVKGRSGIMQQLQEKVSCFLIFSFNPFPLFHFTDIHLHPYTSWKKRQTSGQPKRIRNKSLNCVDVSSPFFSSQSLSSPAALLGHGGRGMINEAWQQWNEWNQLIDSLAGQCSGPKKLVGCVDEDFVGWLCAFVSGSGGVCLCVAVCNQLSPLMCIHLCCQLILARAHIWFISSSYSQHL